MDLDGDGVISVYEMEYCLLLLCMRWSTVYYCSIEYWFRCMDLDGDGVISMYEMEYCLLL